MKILVIGGTGNISRWFVPLLIGAGHEVTLYNRGISEGKFEGDIKQIIGDRTDHTTFENQMRNAPMYDCVIDMVGFEPEDASSCIRAFSGRTAQFIFCSTVDVFHKQPLAYPVNEQGEIKASASFPYAAKKVEMEKIFRSAHERKQLPVTIIRPAATYSEGRSPLVTPFGGQTYHLDRITKGKPIILHGDGSAIWVATHSVDVAKCFSNAAGNVNTIGKAYNVTGDELMTWRSMHQMVAKVLHTPIPKFVYIPTEDLSMLAPEESKWCVENFQYNNIFDNSLAKAELDFHYTVLFEEGAKRCIQFLIENKLIESEVPHRFYDDLIVRWNFKKNGHGTSIL